MKFNIVLGLTTILYMAPNAVAWNLPAAVRAHTDIYLQAILIHPDANLFYS